MASNGNPTRRLPKGIRRRASGKLQAYVRIRGKLTTKTYPAGTSLEKIKSWREEQKLRAKIGATLPPTGNTLAADVKTYLAQRKTMPTLRHRTDDLALWLRVFGADRIRKSITAGEIREQLETWRAEGYAASTVNHRRTALMSLWSVLDGRRAPNPAADCPRFTEASQGAPARDLSLAAVDAVLERMAPSPTRARLELFRWTGWPPAQMAKLTPADIRWDDAVFVRPREKGAGVRGEWLPLLPQAWAALREFKRLGCWGSFSPSSVRKSFRLAARHARRAIAAARARGTVDRTAARALWAELRDVTPYQLRHTFGTLIAAIGKDDRATQTLMQHADIRTTHRYTKAVTNPRAADALQKVAQQLPSVEITR